MDGLRSTGTLKYQVLFVNYPDSVKMPKGYTKQFMSQIDLEEVSNYYYQVSNKKSKVKFNIEYSWITLPNNSYDYRMHTHGEQDWQQIERNYLSAVVSAADPKIDFSKVDGIYIIPDPNLTPFYVALVDPIVADGKSLKAIVYNQSNSFQLTHELLHTLGLRDLYAKTDLWGPSGGMEQFSIMSQFYGGTSLLGYEKYSLGWMSEKDVICQESGSISVKLNTFDSKGTKLVLLPINGQELLAIEYRKNQGVDKYLGTTGTLIYSIKPNLYGISPTESRSPLSIIFFGKKGNIDYAGIKINIKKNNITINR